MMIFPITIQKAAWIMIFQIANYITLAVTESGLKTVTGGTLPMMKMATVKKYTLLMVLPSRDLKP